MPRDPLHHERPSLSRPHHFCSSWFCPGGSKIWISPFALFSHLSVVCNGGMLAFLWSFVESIQSFPGRPLRFHPRRRLATRRCRCHCHLLACLQAACCRRNSNRAICVIQHWHNIKNGQFVQTKTRQRETLRKPTCTVLFLGVQCSQPEFGTHCWHLFWVCLRCRLSLLDFYLWYFWGCT